MFVIWLGAFVSLALAMFTGYSSQLTSSASAAGMLTSVATRLLPWLLGGSDVDVGWRVFVAVFCISAVASLSAYVSQTQFMILVCSVAPVCLILMDQEQPWFTD